MRRFSTSLLITVILSTCIGCDQLTKDMARDRLRNGTSVTILEDVAKLVYTENAGIAFGIGAGLSGDVRFWLFTVGITGALVLMSITAYRRRDQGLLYRIGFTLLIAGGVSNLLDRILNEGRVVDLMLLRLSPFRTIVFNLADVLVLTGAALLVWSAIRTAASVRGSSEAWPESAAKPR